MPEFKVDILPVGAPPPNIGHKITKIKEGEIIHVGVLENGTESGQTTLYITIDMHNGEHVCCQTTLNLLNMLHGIANGADKRFKECKDYGKN